MKRRVTIFAGLVFVMVFVLQVGASIIRSTRAEANPQFCTLDQRPIITGTTAFSLYLPPAGHQLIQPAVVSPIYSPYWADAIPGSQWIANTVYAAQNQPPGDYTYVYSFCLCSAPSSAARQMQVPGAMTLSLMADDQASAYLNDYPPFIHLTGGYGFQAPHNGSAQASAFHAGLNTLKIVVNNSNGAGSGTPTGLDVSGSVSGYFSQPPCKRPPQPQPSPPTGGARMRATPTP